ncbi:aconitate hydratase 1, partial [mine drainage metagenome]
MVAYALAGTVDIDLNNDPIGTDKSGQEVYLRDIWPSQKEIADTVAKSVLSSQFKQQYANVFAGSDEWKAIKTSIGDQFEWDPKSTYIQEPPFFVGLKPAVEPIQPIKAARCLAFLGDSITTDHI